MVQGKYGIQLYLPTLYGCLILNRELNCCGLNLVIRFEPIAMPIIWFIWILK